MPKEVALYVLLRLWQMAMREILTLDELSKYLNIPNPPFISYVSKERYLDGRREDIGGFIKK